MAQRSTKRKRAGIYCRVSTERQNLDTQLLQLRDFASRRNFDITAEYNDIGVSGMKDRRPGLDALLKSARAREIDIVLVARFDRFARSVSHLVRALEEFQLLGIDFISLSESVDTSSAMGKAVFTILGAVAELERSLIVERINAGLARARKQGKRLGRPVAIFDREKAIHLRKQGLSIRKIAYVMRVNRETVRQVFKQENGPGSSKS